MSAVIVIPSRYGSSRFPGKPLTLISGLSLIRRMWMLASAVPSVTNVIVATDDQRIAEHVQSFGGNIVMTRPECANGTERVYEAVAALTSPPDIIVNLQGDSVLTLPAVIEDLISCMRVDTSVGMATPAVRLTESHVADILAARERGESGGTFVTFRLDGRALYFSRSLIPNARDKKFASHPFFRHIGLYAYRFETLKQYLSMKPSPLELAEQLEQLRALEYGIPIKVVEVDYQGRTHCSIDTPADVLRAEQIIAAEGEILARQVSKK